MTFGEKLVQLRNEAGLTQEKLARAADVSIGNVKNYEQGLRHPRWDIVFKLADALGKDCSVFRECVNAKPAEPAPAKKTRKGK